MVRNLLYSALFLLLALSCSVPPVSLQEPLRDEDEHSRRAVIREIDALVNHPFFEHSHWGVMIKSLETGKIWYEHNADRMFNPASNTKIPTTASTLLLLGPDYRFTSLVLSSGSLQDSVLNGDLVLWSHGDPTLYKHFFDSPLQLFRQWADSLKAQGIRRISGNIIGDDSAFDDNPYGYGWSWDNFDYYYSAENGPLQLNENYIDIQIIAPGIFGGSMDSVQIIPSANSAYFTVVNELQLSDTLENSINVLRDPETNTFTLSGTLKRDSDTLEVSPTVSNPTLFYAVAFREILLGSGIMVDGVALDSDDAGNSYTPVCSGPLHEVGSEIALHRTAAVYDTLILHRSAPLDSILTKLMKRSQNLYAETMTRNLGYEFCGFGSFDSGAVAVSSALASMGIEPGSYRYMDGSGLSRYNYFSPRQFITILEFMNRSPYADIWCELSPVAGVDGTLKNRMKGTRAQGNARAKTGTLSNVRGLSGYIRTADGELLACSFLVNGHLHSANDVDRITDRILVKLANLNRSFR